MYEAQNCPELLNMDWEHRRIMSIKGHLQTVGFYLKNKLASREGINENIWSSLSKFSQIDYSQSRLSVPSAALTLLMDLQRTEARRTPTQVHYH